MKNPRHGVVLIGVAALVALLAGAASAGAQFSPWSGAQKIDEIGGNSAEVNTAFLDGCPIQSPDGLSLYLASNRPRFAGDTRTDLDIWVARRTSENGPWGAPVNLGEPVNSAFDDFCPTPVGAASLFFVSREPLPGSCGLGDIYLTHLTRRGWREPEHLACSPEGPNSALDEQGPSYVRTEWWRAQLYFSRSSATVPGDIYVSESRFFTGFGPASPVVELNSAGNDIQPNVRRDGREIVFSSNAAHPGAQGGQDVYGATRETVRDPWSAPTNLGAAVNTSGAETRPSLSRDARTLLFGRAPGPEGMSDIYVSTRGKTWEGAGDTSPDWSWDTDEGEGLVGNQG